jgi:hypothetical protein
MTADIHVTEKSLEDNHGIFNIIIIMSAIIITAEHHGRLDLHSRARTFPRRAVHRAAWLAGALTNLWKTPRKQ